QVVPELAQATNHDAGDDDANHVVGDVDPGERQVRIERGRGAQHRDDVDTRDSGQHDADRDGATVDRPHVGEAAGEVDVTESPEIIDDGDEQGRHREQARDGAEGLIIHEI